MARISTDDIGEGGKFLNLPPPARYIQMEVENYERLIKEDETKGRRKGDMQEMFLELVSRKDLFRIATSEGYVSPLDVTRNQKNALIKIFYALQGFGWKRQFGWIGQDRTVSRPEVRIFESDAGICDGLTVSKIVTLENKKGQHGILTKIDFSGHGCIGELVPQFGEFEFLRELLLGYNMIEGLIPGKLKLLERLEVLIMNGNRLSGSMDSQTWSSLGKLKILDVSFNSLNGMIPDIFDRFPNLETLNLSGNQFSGYLPPSLSECKGIKQIMIYNNLLIGSIPEEFKFITTLEKINLSRNKLTGGIRFLLNNVNIKTLNLSYNLMEEDLPLEMSRLTDLTILYLHNNKFGGRIHPDWCKSMSKLQLVNLSNNDIEGIVPEEIGLLKDLISLILKGCRIRAPLPKSFSELKSLRDFTAFENYPAHIMKTARAFTTHGFQRMHVYGPKVGVDNVYFLEERLYGPDLDGLTKLAKTLDLFPSHSFHSTPDHSNCYKSNPDHNEEPE